MHFVLAPLLLLRLLPCTPTPQPSSFFLNLFNQRCSLDITSPMKPSLNAPNRSLLLALLHGSTLQVEVPAKSFHSLGKYLLITCHGLGTALGPRDTAVSLAGMTAAFTELAVQ